MSVTPLRTISKTSPTPRIVPLDVAAIRRDFPILAQRVQDGKPLVYLDNAASTQKPAAVIEAIRDYYEKDHANVHRAVHVLSERATKAYEEARLKVQKFINANCLREIIYTKGTTDAINLVAASLGQSLKPGDEIVLTALEHHSNIVPWQQAAHANGATLKVVPVDDAGALRLDELERLLGPRVKLLSLAHVSNALGTVNPIKEIVALAHGRGIPVFVDGAQAVAHLKVDVRELDCDFYAFSGHKMYGPTGIGILYGKAKHLETMPPYQTGGDMIAHVSFEKTTWNELPYKFEAGTPNIAGAVGLGAAIDYIESRGRDAIAAHDRQLLDRATERLAAIPGVRIIGRAPERAGAISFVVENPPIAAVDVGTRLDLEGIAIRTGHHCCQPLMERFAIPGTARASFAMYNTLAEVDRFVDVLETIVAEAKPRATAPVNGDVTYAAASAGSPTEAAAELSDFFDFVEDWAEKYAYIIDLGTKLPPMPAYLRTEPNRVRGCQSTVFLDLRKKAGTADVVEFLCDSDADIVRGLIAILEKLFSGQRAKEIAAFDLDGFFRRIGLDKNLTMGRRNGLAEMANRIRTFAAQVAASECPQAVAGVKEKA
jgi:cysteine desulfurase/selenocysteine lyase